MFKLPPLMDQQLATNAEVQEGLTSVEKLLWMTKDQVLRELSFLESRLEDVPPALKYDIQAKIKLLKEKTSKL